jgi:thiol-disulfide isomerase/thioredoxin
MPGMGGGGGMPGLGGMNPAMLQQLASRFGGMGGGGLGGMAGALGGGAAAGGSGSDPKLGEVCTIANLAHLRKIIGEYPGVFVDFWNEGCPPCRRIKPVFENLARMNENENIVFCAVNTRTAPDAAGAYQVSAIPNFIAFLNGQ